jgi:selenium metabolism protein YedF
MGNEMHRMVDARGQACPQPVILTRKAMAEAESVTTIVDNETSRHNVSRMAEKQGWQAQVETKSDGIYLHLTRAAAASQSSAAPQPAAAPSNGPIVVLIGAEALGQGDDELGRLLMRSFLHTLGESKPLPDTLIFLNGGVKLVTVGSPVVDDLKALRDAGVEILACGTCLGHFGLKERVAVGEISNMYTIVEHLLGASKILRM